MDYASMSPREVRALIREGKITGPTGRHVRRLCTGQSGDSPKDWLMIFFCLPSETPGPAPFWKCLMQAAVICILWQMTTLTLQRTFRDTGSMKTASLPGNIQMFLRFGEMI